MKTFKDLKFSDHPNPASPFGSIKTQATLFFENGYGVSVITGPGAYGANDQYELAVLIGSDGEWSLTYDTPITNDVLGYLNEIDVTSHMQAVEALPQP